MGKQRILLQDWAQLHPYLVGSRADSEYVRVANRVYEVYRQTALVDCFGGYLDVMVCCGLTAYLEDCVSESGMWKAFVSACREHYKSPLPFFQVDEETYRDDEINVEDVNFLLWHYVQSCQEEPKVLFNPFNPEITRAAKLIYDVLDEEFERVPVNGRFAEYCRTEIKYDDFYSLRHLLLVLAERSFLFWPSELEVDRTLEYLMRERDNISDLEYENYRERTRELLLFVEPTCLMGIFLHEWVARLLGESHPAYSAIMNIRYGEGFYDVLEDNQEGTLVRDWETGSEFWATWENVPANEMDLKNRVLECYIVEYNGKYWFNFAAEISREAALKRTEDDNLEERNKQIVHEIFLKKNKGKPIVYCRDWKDIEKFLVKKLEYEIPSDLLKNMKKQFSNSDNYAIYTTLDEGLSVISNYAESIKDKDNPFYDPEKASEKAIGLYLERTSCSLAFLNYLLENDMLPDACMKSLQGPEVGRRLFIRNSDFLVHYYRFHEFVKKRTNKV